MTKRSLNALCAVGAISGKTLGLFYLCLMEAYTMGHDDVVEGMKRRGKLNGRGHDSR